MSAVVPLDAEAPPPCSRRTRQVAELLGVTTNTLAVWKYKGFLHHAPDGKWMQGCK